MAEIKKVSEDKSEDSHNSDSELEDKVEQDNVEEFSEVVSSSPKKVSLPVGEVNRMRVIKSEEPSKEVEDFKETIQRPNRYDLANSSFVPIDTSGRGYDASIQSAERRQGAAVLEPNHNRLITNQSGALRERGVISEAKGLSSKPIEDREITSEVQEKKVKRDYYV